MFKRGGSNVLVTELKQIVMLGLVIIFKFLKIYSGVEISVISFVQWYQKFSEAISYLFKVENFLKHIQKSR